MSDCDSLFYDLHRANFDEYKSMLCVAEKALESAGIPIAKESPDCDFTMESFEKQCSAETQTNESTSSCSSSLSSSEPPIYEPMTIFERQVEEVVSEQVKTPKRRKLTLSGEAVLLDNATITYCRCGVVHRVKTKHSLWTPRFVTCFECDTHVALDYAINCICKHINPPSVGDKEADRVIDWIACDRCHCWQHQECLGEGLLASCTSDDRFLCVFCKHAPPP